ncbi:MAG: hypothetical protein ACW96U_00735 [Candidatus Heimdallarchaeaceae archaeon]|jgi:hypothetical protein
MNVAKRTLSYYESEDFEDMYSEVLYDIVIDEDEKRWKKALDEIGINADSEFLEEIKEYVIDNMWEFTERASGYWMRSGEVARCCFGEQEEQLTGIYNHRTEKDYGIQYLRKIFKQEDFFVKENYAYYDLSDEGIAVVLNRDKIQKFIDGQFFYNPDIMGVVDEISP